MTSSNHPLSGPVPTLPFLDSACSWPNGCRQVNRHEALGSSGSASTPREWDGDHPAASSPAPPLPATASRPAVRAAGPRIPSGLSAGGSAVRLSDGPAVRLPARAVCGCSPGPEAVYLPGSCCHLEATCANIAPSVYRRSPPPSWVSCPQKADAGRARP